MSTDIATLGIRVDATQVSAGSKALDSLEASSRKVETATQSAARQFASMAAAVGVGTSATQILQRAISEIINIFKKGFSAVDEYKSSIASLAAMVTTFAERQKGVTLEQQWQKALSYSTSMVPILENIAAKTLLSGQETTALANALARAGVFLDANNAKQIEAFTRISNALPLMTQGQSIMMQINSEIRGVMTGQNEQTSMMLQTLKAIDPQIESNLKTWRAEGSVLEHIGELLSGFGPATALLENQWQAVKSTLDTTVTQVLRGGMQTAYDNIIDSVKKINNSLDEHKGTIGTGITVAWNTVSNIVGAVMGVLSGFGPMLKDIGGFVSAIAYGWGGVAAVLKPIGELIGNQIAFAYQLVKMIYNAAMAGAALATGNVSAAQTLWEDAKKNYDEANRLAISSGKIVTEGIVDSIAKYDLQSRAALNSANTVSASEALKSNHIAERSKKAISAEEAIKEAIIKATAEIEGVGYSHFDKEMARIQAQADKYTAAGASKVSVAQYVAAETALLTAQEAQREKEANDAALKDFRELKAKENEETAKAAEQYRKIVASEYEYGTSEYERSVNAIVAKEAEKLNELDELYTKLGEQGMMTWEEYQARRQQITSYTESAILVKTKEASLERLKIERDLLVDIRGQNQNAYEAGIALLNSQAQKYRETLITKKTTAEEAAKYEVAIATWVREQTYQLEQKKLKASENWYDGLKAYYDESVHDAKTWAQRTLDIAKSLYNNMATSFGDLFYDAITLNLDQAIEDFNSFGKALLKSFTNVLGEMVATALRDQIVLYFKTTWVSGGSVLDSLYNVLTGTPAASSVDENVGDWAATAYDYGSHATGGSYQPGQPFWAGERGAELIFPTSSGGGYVLTHEQSVAYASRRGASIPGYAEGTVPEYPSNWYQWSGMEWLWDKLSDAQKIAYETTLLKYYDQPDPGTSAQLEANFAAGITTKRYGDYFNTYLDGELVSSVYSPDTGPGTLGTAVQIISTAVMSALTGGAASSLNSALASTLVGSGMAGMTAYTASGGDLTSTLIAAITGGVGGYMVSGKNLLSMTSLSQLFSLDTLKSAAEKYALKTGLNIGIGSLTGSGGTLSTSYYGAEDNGLLAYLASIIGGTNGQFAFPLASGGRFGSGDVFWTGERGAELVFSDGSGGYVLNHEQSVAYASRRGASIPGYAEGTVPYDNFPELLDRGEEVKTAAAAAREFDLTPIKEELQKLRTIISELVKITREQSKDNRTTARVLQRVTRDGDAMITESA